ncbi:hypothetical protein L0B53_00165 [Vibrio sp. SS-MA-C1-2]|uniref:hypothetical protein n=1 Tax=Vibrio sp. SS-MA-C1-2 TaxID=2908646 RepID=UPI001F33A39C|nr:hypothetical protein [Vibrio sp. SS-MA-C1-2]UJF17226.1 hypothetical protein L0B53_00165 [Vibrio sp. SS-MA-C1-2]
MTATVQTVKKFCEETGISHKQVIHRMNIGDIPEVERVNRRGTRLINKLAFDRLVENNEFYLRDLVSDKDLNHV